MDAETSGWGSKLFPEIRICFAARAPVALSPWAQAILLSVVVLGTAALSYLGLGRIGDKRLVADKEAVAARIGLANTHLHDEIVGLQKKITGLTQDREQADRRVATLADQAGELRGLLDTTEAKLQSLNQSENGSAGQKSAAGQQQAGSAATPSARTDQSDALTRAVDQARQALDQERTQNAALTAQLGKAEADRAAEEAQFAQYKASLEEIAKQLEQPGPARDKGTVQRARLRVRLGELWQKLSQLPGPQPAQQATAAGPTAPPAGGASADVSTVARLGGKEISAVEHVLASTGIDIARLYSQFGVNRAEGGPFVPPPKAGQPIDAVDPQKLAAIRGLANVLPLSAPLAQYQIGSPFGPRTDPFNGRAAFHTGIDMDAPYNTPVYATAPGTVIYAGYLGDYGKVIEIDHGFGIDTLYAHLHRYLVAVGDNVAARAEIGLVGTTGRSSGPHVHYEVRVNGVPQDPEKFLGLSRLIPVTANQLIPPAAAPAGNSR